MHSRLSLVTSTIKRATHLRRRSIADPPPLVGQSSGEHSRSAAGSHLSKEQTRASIFDILKGGTLRIASGVSVDIAPGVP